MDNQKDSPDKVIADDKKIEELLNSASKLSPLDLNNIKLDVRHTVLTPDYLEELIKS